MDFLLCIRASVFLGTDRFLPSLFGLKKIAEQDGGKYETAVYAVQCKNSKCMLPICTDRESACWVMAKSWLYVQVDLELALSQPGRMDHYGNIVDGNPGQIDTSLQSSVGPENGPLQVLNQQPRQLSALFQKLHSGAMVYEAVTRGCREKHRQIENIVVLTVGNIKRAVAGNT